MRFAVVGAGGVGGYFGGRLAQDGNEVSFVARGAHLDAIRRHGLRVESIAGDFVVDPARATDDAAEVGPVEAVIIAVKAWQLDDAAQAARPLVGPDTVVLPLLNGVRAARRGPRQGACPRGTLQALGRDRRARHHSPHRGRAYPAARRARQPPHA